jgi:hypothetical protein
VIELHSCKTCDTPKATWVLWTKLTVNFYCDACRDHVAANPETFQRLMTGSWEFEHCPEGVLDTGGMTVLREPKI